MHIIATILLAIVELFNNGMCVVFVLLFDFVISLIKINL